MGWASLVYSQVPLKILILPQEVTSNLRFVSKSLAMQNHLNWLRERALRQ